MSQRMHNRGKTAWIKPLVIGVVIIVVGCLGAVQRHFFGPPDADLCYDAVHDHTAVLADMTTRLKPHVFQSIKHQIDQELAALQPGGRLSLFVLTPYGKSAVSLLFSMCKAEDPNTVNPFIGNKRMAQERVQTFEAAYAEALKQLTLYEDAKQSPITQGIHELVTGQRITRLVVFSDMEENTDAYSVPLDTGSAEAYERSLYVSGLAGKLRGIAVLIVQFTAERIAHRQQQSQAYWTALWNSAEASVEMVELPEAF
jgi:hypothetical protein